MEVSVSSYVVCIVLAFLSVACRGEGDHENHLRPGMPNVCSYRDMQLVRSRKPSTRTRSTLVKIHKADCATRARWEDCFDYEPRTVYYSTHIGTFERKYRTVYGCCEGWTLDEDKRNCNIDIDECQTHQHRCVHSCVNTPGSYRCSCRAEYQLATDGVSCFRIDVTVIYDCGTDNGGCQHKCHRGQSGVLCSCNPGYHLESDGKSCAVSSRVVERSSSKDSANKTGGSNHSLENRACAPGFFGLHCQYSCSNCTNGLCNSLAGCQCHAGYRGVLCNETCLQGTYGINCREPCQCQNGGTCHTATGKCFCSPGSRGKFCERRSCPLGFYGRNCDKECPRNCPLGRCNRRHGYCECPSGRSGQNCNLPCQAFTYGPNCRKPCKCNTAQTQGCNPKNGRCVCKPGYTGRFCNKRCPSGTWGTKCAQVCKCPPGSSCDPSNGTCLVRCSSGAMAQNCSEGSVHETKKYRGCPKGFYGRDCTLPCLCEPNADCESLGGACICHPGWRGTFCELPCPRGFYGLDCQMRCICPPGIDCDHATGKCLCVGRDCVKGPASTVCDGTEPGEDCDRKRQCVHGTHDPVSGRCVCALGYTGPLCDKECPGGYYGQSCLGSCLCKNGGTCNMTDGTCLCPTGLKGRYCQTEDVPSISTEQGSLLKGCGANRYGLNCERKCECVHGTCSRADGKCACSSGYTGPLCDKECPGDSYGENCLNSCLCMNGGTCNQTDGSCLCPPGIKGRHCQEVCAQGFYGYQCSSSCYCVHGTCDARTGMCRCSPGFRGPNCEETCPVGTYGPGCKYQCSCLNGGGCDSATGRCMCLDGYFGPTCSLACADGTYGENCQHHCACQNGATCDHVDGNCTCTPGFRGQHCDKVCLDGWYGVNCSQKCECGGSTCHPVTGRCRCPPGRRGDQCENECQASSYGPGCMLSCECSSNAMCDKATGQCICARGWMGPNCTEKEDFSA